MFTDPLTCTPGATFDAGAVSLPRISQSGQVSVYRGTPSVNAGAYMQITASHQTGRRIRRSLRLDYGDNAASTLISGTTAPRSCSFYIVADLPPANAFTAANAQALINGLKGTWSASSDAVLLKWLAGES